MEINLSSIRIREIKQGDMRLCEYGEEGARREALLILSQECRTYNAFLNPSLDILEFRHLAKKMEEKQGIQVITSHGGVDYTDIFINVKLEKDSTTRLYEEGFFESDGEECWQYVEYKRSGNAAKNGKHLFIRKDFHASMMNWTWMGRPPVFDEIRMSYVERKAYESLVNSTIKDAVVIDPEGILVLDDIENHFKTNAAMVGLKNESEASLTRAIVECTNMVTDGECLIDDSVFGARDAGMMLLRNFFFKSCGFRTDIQGYYKEVFGNEYETATIEDRWGYPIPVKNIRMIVTNSSFKLFKFNTYMAKEEPEYNIQSMHGGDISEEYDMFQENGLNTFLLWVEAVKKNGGIFGVVKFEEKHCDNRHFTYQMINSMNLSRDDVNGLMEEDIKEYIRLKTDDEAYEEYIGGGQEGDTEPTYTDDFLLNMSRKNPMFRQTKVYKDKKYKFLTAYLQKLYEGKISVDADYRTLCSMPWELLTYSVHRDVSRIEPVLKKGEVCILDIPEGEKVVLCRNPHTCASNVVCATNRIPDEIKLWFGFERKDHTSNIVVLSPWEWDVMAALNGADFDSDEALCIREPIVVKRAEELLTDEIIASVPHEVTEDFTNDKKIMRGINDYESQKETDQILFNNNIGRISNYVQALNSYYWHVRRNEGIELCNQGTLYDDIQILSVLIGLEIDKAKHAYSVNACDLAKKLVAKHINYATEKPLFMRFIDEHDRKKAKELAASGKWLDCPMDYVAERIYNLKDTEEELANQTQTPTIPIKDLFDIDDYKGCDAKKVEAVMEKLDNCISVIRKLNMNKEKLDWEDNVRLKNQTLDETYDLMRRNKIKIKELKRILYIILEKDVTDLIKQGSNKMGFFKALLVNNNDSIKDILDRKDYEKKQINYKKCRQLFEMYLEQNPKTDEEIYAFGEKIKKEKNTANLEYMINVLAEKRKYTSARYEVLMSLSILYHMWPDLFEKCLKNAKN